MMPCVLLLLPSLLIMYHFGLTSEPAGCQAQAFAAGAPLVLAFCIVLPACALRADAAVVSCPEGTAGLIDCTQARAAAGSRLHQDRLDGYYFFYPDTWSPVTV